MCWNREMEPGREAYWQRTSRFSIQTVPAGQEEIQGARGSKHRGAVQVEPGRLHGGDTLCASPQTTPEGRRAPVQWVLGLLISRVRGRRKEPEGRHQSTLSAADSPPVGTLTPYHQAGLGLSIRPGNPCVDGPTSPASLPLPSAWAGLEYPGHPPPLAWCHLKAGHLPQTQLCHSLCSGALFGSVPGQALLLFGGHWGLDLWAERSLRGKGGKWSGSPLGLCSPLGCVAFSIPSFPLPAPHRRGAQDSPQHRSLPSGPTHDQHEALEACGMTQTLTISKPTDVTPPNFGE